MSGSNRAWMPLHIAEYLADTGHLSATEHGAYLLLIMHYWQHSGLPENERLIARIAKLSPEQWEESRDILAMLFSDGWRHKRVDAELAKADEIIEKRRAAADARHGKGKRDANAQQVQSICSDTRVPPSTDNHPSSLRSEGEARPREPSPTDRAFEVFTEAARACKVPVPRSLTADRRRKIEARLREHGEDGWREACRKLAASPFCNGQNDRGWVADLDFLCQPKSFNRLIEGGYDDRPAPQARGSPPKPKSDFDQFTDYLYPEDHDDGQGNPQGNSQAGGGLRLIAGHRQP